ncbi:uncharacterized protein LOC109601109 [Aethina tumida]|uniref:uncharacterized protein LOC109601109 n=1 Tax=Aethina tumida TaxID=116153 RepID=UPI00096AE27A|nr:uncharacterized protein LOC109601109 [Aethina tumida]
MYIKSLIILGLVAHCLCYDWDTEGKKFNKACADVKNGYVRGKIREPQIKNQIKSCLGAHIGSYGKQEKIQYYMTKAPNPNEAYSIFKTDFSISVDSFHNFVYCLEGLLRK